MNRSIFSLIYFFLCIIYLIISVYYFKNRKISLKQTYIYIFNLIIIAVSLAVGFFDLGSKYKTNTATIIEIIKNNLNDFLKLFSNTN
jgi:hypothetical protein